MSYYHYTKGFHLPKIVKSGFIKLSTTLIEKREKPAVWLTKSPVWESACNVGIILNIDKLKEGSYYFLNDIDSVTASDEYMRTKIGMCRILVKESLPTITWGKFKHVSGISEVHFNAQDSYNRSIGCPVGLWRCTFHPIFKVHWEGIEIFVQDQWVRWDEKMPIEEFLELCMSCNKNQIAA